MSVVGFGMRATKSPYHHWMQLPEPLAQYDINEGRIFGDGGDENCEKYQFQPSSARECIDGSAPLCFILICLRPFRWIARAELQTSLYSEMSESLQLDERAGSMKLRARRNQ